MQRPRPPEVHHDVGDQHGERPHRQRRRRHAVAQPAAGLDHDAAGEDIEQGDDAERRQALQLAVAVMVLGVGRLVGSANHEPGDDGGDHVGGAAVQRLRDQRDAADGDADGELGRRQAGAGHDRARMPPWLDDCADGSSSGAGRYDPVASVNASIARCTSSSQAQEAAHSVRTILPKRRFAAIKSTASAMSSEQRARDSNQLTAFSPRARCRASPRGDIANLLEHRAGAEGDADIANCCAACRSKSKSAWLPPRRRHRRRGRAPSSPPACGLRALRTPGR